MAVRPVLRRGDLDDQLCAAYKGAGVVAVDTETSGLNWREDRLHLVQISAPRVGSTLVQVTSSSMPSLNRLLTDPDVVTVFHFAPFDLRFLSQVGVSARNVRCTKAAAKLLWPAAAPRDHSLASLLDRELGIVLDKGDVRVSDWGARELRPEQIDYAVSDVAHLAALHDHLSVLLEQGDLSRLYAAICSYLPVDALLETSGVPDPLTY